MRYRASYGVSPRHETADLMSIAYLPGNKIGREEGTLASQGGRPGERNKGDSEAPLNLAHARGEQPALVEVLPDRFASRPRARGATASVKGWKKFHPISPTRAGSSTLPKRRRSGRSNRRAEGKKVWQVCHNLTEALRPETKRRLKLASVFNGCLDT